MPLEAKSRDAKRQFNVYLPAELVRRVKHAAIDHANSLSEFVEHALEDSLERLPAAGEEPSRDQRAAHRLRH